MNNQRQNNKKSTPHVPAKVIGWLGLGRWMDLYKPIRNPALRGEGTPIECMFETFGSELATVKATPENKIWTWVDEGRHQLLYAGYHIVNRFGYFICKVPWKDRGTVVIYKTDRFVNVDSGSPDVIARTSKLKLELGAQCNRLLDLAEDLEDSSKAWHHRCASDLRSIIDRVAEAEKLKT